MVIPPSPTTEVNAPSPIISAPSSCAICPQRTILSYTTSSGRLSIMRGESGQPMNQPSVSAPVSERTPVMRETTIGSLRNKSFSTQRSGRYFAMGYLRAASRLTSTGWITKANRCIQVGYPKMERPLRTGGVLLSAAQLDLPLRELRGLRTFLRPKRYFANASSYLPSCISFANS
jgi:hypothetical protein